MRKHIAPTVVAAALLPLLMGAHCRQNPVEVGLGSAREAVNLFDGAFTAWYEHEMDRAANPERFREIDAAGNRWRSLHTQILGALAVLEAGARSVAQPSFVNLRRLLGEAYGLLLEFGVAVPPQAAQLLQLLNVEPVSHAPAPAPAPALAPSTPQPASAPAPTPSPGG